MTRRELRENWLNALHSGDYTQTTGRLRRGDSHCCLGVLCDVAGLRAVASVIDSSPGFSFRFETFVLPWGLTTAVGLRSQEGSAPNLPALSVLNDSGAPLPVIARLLESSASPYWDPAADLDEEVTP